MEQRGIDELDIQNIIRTGQVTQQTLSRFTVAGKTVEEKSASCVVEIKKNLLVITVTPPGKKPKKRR
jgi:hypothetical protein